MGDLVITKLTLTVDKRFGKYAMCNICVNHTALGVRNCTDGKYVCACGGFFHSKPCGPTVGQESVLRTHYHPCISGMHEWECWKGALPQKTQGLWYSTTAAGYCGDGSKPAPAGCTWTVKEVPKIVNKTCSDNSIYGFLENYDGNATKCFASCSDSGVGPSRNTSSTCWVNCLYTALLGPEGGKPGGKLDGIPMQEIVGTWEKAFLSSKVSEGGCPALPPPQVGACTEIGSDGQAFPTNMLCNSDRDCSTNSYCNFHSAAVEGGVLV